MRNVLIGAGVVVAVLVAALFLVPLLIPPEVLKPRVQAAASEALGRPVTIAGDVRVAVLPRIEARAAGVTIANPEGFSQSDFATADELRAALALLPLLARKVEVTEFVLTSPSITLEQKRNGENNWTFGSPEGAGAPKPPGAPFKRRPGALPLEAAFGDVRLVDGSVRYIDRASGTEHAVSDLDLKIDLPSLSKPLNLDGDLVLDGNALSVTARLDSLRGFFDGKTAPFSLDLKSDLAVVSAKGRFAESEDLDFSGDVKAEAPSLRALADAFDVDLPPGAGIYKRFSVEGAASGAPDNIVFENAKLAFDAIRGEGSFTADLRGAKPKVRGDLALGALDLNPYLPESAKAKSVGGGAPAWSEEPMDLSALKAVDAELSLTATSLAFQEYRFGASRIEATLDNGRLDARLSELNAYDGTAIATVVVNVRPTTPTYTLNADLTGVQAQPLLKAAANFSRLIGVGGAEVNVTAKGRSQAEIMRSLDGTGGFDFRDGALKGINLGAVARGVEGAIAGNFDASAFSSSQSTDFSELVGAFTVKNGVAQTREFRMLSPLLRVDGQGALDIGRQAVDFALTPTLVASTAGQGGAVDLKGLAIPVRIKGSWSSISMGLDQQAVAKAAAAKALGGSDAGKLIDEKVGGEAGGVLRGLLGLPPAPPPEETEDEAASDEPAAEPAAPAEPAEPAAPEEEEEEEEDPFAKALGDLFGKSGGDDDE